MGKGLISSKDKLKITRMKKILRAFKHGAAVMLGVFRRPGRFSIYHYGRPEAMKYLKAAEDGIVLDLGCGSRFLSPKVIGVDLMPGQYVKLISDAEKLPLKDKSCDGIWMDAILEHTVSPENLLREARRVLKEGGWLYAEIPFLQGEHQAPADYRRWTRDGLRQLFNAWNIQWVDNVVGPFSVISYQLRCCFSLLTSFGSDKTYRIVHEAVWSYVFWPIKFLDIFFKNHPRAKENSFGFGIMVKKEIE